MGQSHKHRDLIRAWADGAEIQISVSRGELWEDAQPNFLVWNDEYQYRIKPEPKPDFVMFANGLCYDIAEDCIRISYPWSMTIKFDSNLKLTFDGETGELKSAEVLK